MSTHHKRTVSIPTLETLDDRMLPSSLTAGTVPHPHAAQVAAAHKQTPHAARRLRLAAQRAARAEIAAARAQAAVAAKQEVAVVNVPSGPLYYNSAPGVPTDGGPVIVRDTGAVTSGDPAMPNGSTNPQTTPGKPVTGFYYSANPVPANDGGFAIGRGVTPPPSQSTPDYPDGGVIPDDRNAPPHILTTPSTPTAGGGSFAAPGRPIPGHPGQVFGDAPVSTDPDVVINS